MKNKQRVEAQKIQQKNDSLSLKMKRLRTPSKMKSKQKQSLLIKSFD